MSIFIIVFAFMLIALTGSLVVQNIFNAFLSTGAITNTMVTYPVFVADSTLIYTLDQVVAFMFYGLCIVALLVAAYLDAEPINIPLTIFELPFILIVSFAISNASHAIIANAAFASVVPHFQQTIILFADAPLFIFLFIIAYIAVIVARPAFSNQGGSIGGGGAELIP